MRMKDEDAYMLPHAFDMTCRWMGSISWDWIERLLARIMCFVVGWHDSTIQICRRSSHAQQFCSGERLTQLTQRMNHC